MVDLEGFRIFMKKIFHRSELIRRSITRNETGPSLFSNRSHVTKNKDLYGVRSQVVPVWPRISPIGK